MPQEVCTEAVPTRLPTLHCSNGRSAIHPLVSGKRLVNQYLQVQAPSSLTPGVSVTNVSKLGLSCILCPKHLISLCSGPQYARENHSRWPLEGTRDLNILHDLENLYQPMDKWSELLCIHGLGVLCSQPSRVFALR